MADFYDNIVSNRLQSQEERRKNKGDFKEPNYTDLQPLYKNMKKAELDSEYTAAGGEYDNLITRVGKEDLANEASELRRTMTNLGIFLEPNDFPYHSKFFKYPRLDPYHMVEGVREYVFFTKPDLPILNINGDGLCQHASEIPYFNDLFQSEGYRKAVFSNLCYSYTGKEADRGGGGAFPFIRILSNRKTSNLDIPDITTEEMETSVNMYGSKINYPKSSASSDEDIDFSLEFEDTQFLEIYHLFKAYDEYRRFKWLGLLGPGVVLMEAWDRNQSILDQVVSLPADTIENILNTVMQNALDGSLSNYAVGSMPTGVHAVYADYVGSKILYDHMSAYKFIVANDGETILHAFKATGIYPKTISRSSFSEIPEKGPLKITVGFKGSGWIEDGNIAEIMVDFNALIYSYLGNNNFVNGSGAAPMYDNDIQFGMINQQPVDYPFIYRNPEADKYGFHHYYLEWGNTFESREEWKSKLDNLLNAPADFLKKLASLNTL